MYKPVLLFMLLFSQTVYSQVNLNGDFEKLNPSTRIPVSWSFSFNKEQSVGYRVYTDSLVKQSGKYAVSIQNVNKDAEFAAISYVVSKNFEGKSIELRGYVKTENVNSGYSGLWMRIDGKGGVLAFDNMAKTGIKGTNDWKMYTIKLPYQGEDAVSISIGGLLTGNGQAWFDNFQLFIDDKPVEQLHEKILVLKKAQIDTAFSKSSGIVDIAVTPQVINNLTLTGQFWGFLKYHHTSIAKGDYNWDAELFRLLPSVLKAKDNASLSTTLENFLDKLPVPPVCKSCTSPAPDKISLKPDYGLLFQGSVLSKSLTEKLLYILNNRNTKENYYVNMGGGAGNPKFENELAYAGTTYPDAGYRLLCLYRYWAMINYFFPYKNLIDEDWNKVLNTTLASFINAKNDREYVLSTLKLIARVHDTHANIWGSNKVLNDYKGVYTTPFQAKFIQDSLVVTGFYADSLAAQSKLKIGDIIVSINGKTTTQLVEDFLPLTAASNYDTQLRDLPGNYLLRSNEPSFLLKINRDGKMFEQSVSSVSYTMTYKELDYTKPEGFYLIRKDVGYIYPAKYKNTDLFAIKELFKDTKGIVIDMRCYPSDFMPFTFGNYIKPLSSAFVNFSFGDSSNPGYFEFKNSAINGSSTGAAYQGKVVVIVNAKSQSQAEYTTMAFQSAPNVTVIGSTTAGADGNVSSIVLPGKISTMISGIGIFYPDGTPTQRVGVKIDQKIYPTIRGIKAGRDELLEKALEIAGTQP